MQSVCTQTNASTTNCIYSGTSTVAMSNPVEVYEPTFDVIANITLWLVIVIATVALILKFK